MAKNEKKMPAGVRIERSVWEAAEKIRDEVKKDPSHRLYGSSLSPQGWYSVLVAIALKEIGGE